jgi:hypothetical protein
MATDQTANLLALAPALREARLDRKACQAARIELGICGRQQKRPRASFFPRLAVASRLNEFGHEELEPLGLRRASRNLARPKLHCIRPGRRRNATAAAASRQGARSRIGCGCRRRFSPYLMGERSLRLIPEPPRADTVTSALNKAPRR